MEEALRGLVEFVRDNRSGPRRSFSCWRSAIACLHLPAGAGLGRAGGDRRTGRRSRYLVLAGLDRRRPRRCAWATGCPIGSASDTRIRSPRLAAVQFPDLLPRGEAFVSKWGVPSIYIGRFFGPLRASVPLAAGIFEMPYWRFQVANFASACMGRGAAAVRRRDFADGRNGSGGSLKWSRHVRNNGRARVFNRSHAMRVDAPS